MHCGKFSKIQLAKQPQGSTLGTLLSFPEFSNQARPRAAKRASETSSAATNKSFEVYGAFLSRATIR